MIRIGAAIAVAVSIGVLYAGDDGVPVSVPVTITVHKNTGAPQVTADDVLVSHNHQRLAVTSLTPQHGSAGVDLWVLIDDGSSMRIGTQLGDLKQFVLAQPASTKVGIGYMRNGTVEKVQALTANHALAAKALRLPIGTPGISSSPYMAVESLVRHWPAGRSAHEVLMVSSGIDPFYGPGPQDPYLESAVNAAQRAGVVVYTIYYSGAGRWAHAYWELFWGQHNLAELSDATGGQMYWLGLTDPVSLSPYLNDFDQRLGGQYLLTFMAKPLSKPGFQTVKIRTELPHVSLSGPSKVYVPAGQ